jgi:actin-like ATPase involved in cell morphogenesis
MAKIGLDFGTTYSLASLLRGNEVQSLNGTEICGTPSVFCKWGGKVYIGKEAERVGAGHPAYMLTSIKMKISEHAPTAIIGDGMEIEVKEVVKEIIKHVLHEAEKEIIRSYPDEAKGIEVIATYPVAFGIQACNVITEAIEDMELPSGTKVQLVGTIPEPVAAAVDYFRTAPDAGKKIVVIDIGGGTLEMALMESTPGATYPYTILDQAGENIGGDNFDFRFTAYLKERFKSECGLDLDAIGNEDTKRRMALKLQKQAETVKIALSDAMDATVLLEYRDDFHELPVTREEYQECTCDDFDELRRSMDRFIALARRNGHTIDRMVLTGGTSLDPRIEEYATAKDIRRLDDEDREDYVPPKFSERKRVVEYVNPKEIRDMDEENGVNTPTSKPIPNTVKVVKYSPQKSVSYGAARIAQRNWTERRATHSYGIRYRYEDARKVLILIPKGIIVPVTKYIQSTTRAETSSSTFGVYSTNLEFHEGAKIELKESALQEGRDGKPIEGASGLTLIYEDELKYDETVPKGTVTKDELYLNEFNRLQLVVTDVSTNRRLCRSIFI